MSPPQNSNFLMIKRRVSLWKRSICFIRCGYLDAAPPVCSTFVTAATRRINFFQNSAGLSTCGGVHVQAQGRISDEEEIA
jgi:hypothetical protein